MANSVFSTLNFTSGLKIFSDIGHDVTNGGGGEAKAERNWSGQEDVLWGHLQWSLYKKTTLGTNKYGPYTELVLTYRFNNI